MRIAGAGVAFADRTAVGVRPYCNWSTLVSQLEYGRIATAVRSVDALPTPFIYRFRNIEEAYSLSLCNDYLYFSIIFLVFLINIHYFCNNDRL